MMSKRFIVDKDYPKLIDMETKCFYHIDDSLTNVEIFSARLNELWADCQQFKEENEQLKEEIKRLEKIIWKIQWRFQQEVGIEKAKEHYQKIDKEMNV